MAGTRMLLGRHRGLGVGMCPHGSPNLHSVSLFLLGMRLHLWEEGRQGREKQLLQNPGSSPDLDPQGNGGGARGHHLWLLLAPCRAQSGATNLSHTPPIPRRSLGWGTHTPPQRNRALLYWLLASGEGGDTLGLLRVGEGGRNSRGMLGMLML